MHSVLHQVADIRVATQEPEQFVDDPLQKDLLGRQKRETLLEVETHLVAEDALRTRTRTVTAYYALLFDAAQQVEVLFHRSRCLS